MNQFISKTIKINSKRAHDFIIRPKYHTGTSLGWTYTLDSKIEPLLDDKFLTLAYSNPSANEIENLLHESLSRMSIGKTVGFLNKMNFRELENYLRDENHLPVFEKEDSISIEKSYRYIKNSLLALVLWDKCGASKLQFLDQGAWKKLGLVEKNRNIEKLVSLINSYFSQTKSLELVFVEKDSVSVIVNDFPMDLEVLEIVINEFVNFIEEDSSVKLVAVH